jgi:hypothetical protein
MVISLTEMGKMEKVDITGENREYLFNCIEFQCRSYETFKGRI